MTSSIPATIDYTTIKIKHLSEPDSKLFVSLVSKYATPILEGAEIFRDKIDTKSKISDGYCDFINLVDLAILACALAKPTNEERDHSADTACGELLTEFSRAGSATMEMYLDFKRMSNKMGSGGEGGDCALDTILKQKLYIIYKRFFNIFRTLPQNTVKVFGKTFEKAMKDLDRHNGFGRSIDNRHHHHSYST